MLSTFVSARPTSIRDPAPRPPAVRAARGVEAEEYVDAGISGARARRPALDCLVADARRRHSDVVAMAKLDRLARRARLTVQFLRGVGLASVT